MLPSRFLATCSRRQLGVRTTVFPPGKGMAGPWTSSLHRPLWGWACAHPLPTSRTLKAVRTQDILYGAGSNINSGDIAVSLLGLSLELEISSSGSHRRAPWG